MRFLREIERAREEANPMKLASDAETIKAMVTEAAAELDQWYAESDPWHYYDNPEDTKRRAVLLGELPRRDYAATLDLGCGNGFLTNDLPGKNVVGIDISRRAIEHAQRHASERVRFLASDLFALSPSKVGTFDLVVITGVLYPQYIGQAVLLAQVIVDRLLNPGGVLASVHIESWYKARFPYLLAKQLTYPYREFTHLLEIYLK